MGRQNAGTLTGTFTFASSSNLSAAPISWDIIASSAGTTYPKVEYTTSNSTASYSLSQNYFRLDSGGNEVQLYFAKSLTASGAIISTSVGQAYEHDTAGNRYVTTSGGLVPAVVPLTTAPEPSTAILAGLSTALAGVAIWYRRKRSA
jgi:hypothetical protein